MLLGSGNNATGIYTLNGGTLNVLGGRIFLGGNPNSTSALNINGGTVNKTGEAFVVADGGSNGTSSRTGTVNQVSGTVNSSSELWVGQFVDVVPGLPLPELVRLTGVPLADGTAARRVV